MIKLTAVRCGAVLKVLVCASAPRPSRAVEPYAADVLVLRGLIDQ